MSEPGGEIVVEGVVEFDTARAQSNARRVANAVQQTLDRTLRRSRSATQATEGLNRSLEQTGRTANRTGRQFDSFGGSLDQMEKGLITVAIAATQVGATLSRVITRPVLDTLKEGVLSVSDLDEVINLAGVTFGDSADQVVNWAETLSSSFGLTEQDAIEARSNFALLFNELGIGLEESSALSQQLVERIGDIASLRNVPVPQVIQRIQSGLVGETEAVRRLGIILDESVIKREALTQGIIEQGEALTAEQKVELRAQQILAQTTEAAGDAANTAETFAGVLRRLRVAQDAFARSLGEVILPVATRFGNILISLLEGISRLPITVRGGIVAFGLFAAVLGPLLILIGQLTSALLALRGAMAVLSVQTAAATGALATFRLIVTRVGVALKIAAGPIGLLAAGVIFLKDQFDSSAAAAQELVDAITQDIDFSSLDSVQSGLGDLQLELESQLRTFNEFSGAGGVLRGTVELFTPLENTVLDNANAVKALNNEIGRLQAQFAIGEAIIASVANTTGLTAEQVERLARSLDIDIGAVPVLQELEVIDQLLAGVANIDFGPLNKALEGAIDIQDDLIKLQDRVVSAQDKVSDALERVQDAHEKVADAVLRQSEAQERLVETHERLAELTSELGDLEADRLELLNDTGRDVREVAEAEDDLALIRLRLADLNQRELEIQEEINELNTPATAEELAAADRDVERATLRLNRALREEQELLDELNADQREAVDLTGLSLDQLRTRLAGIRAQTQAQRAVLGAQRSDEEIEEDLVEARLNSEEAQANLNNTIADRNELDNKVINNADTIIGLERDLERIQINRRDTLRDLNDQQDKLNRLRAGETTRAEELEAVDESIARIRERIEDATDNIVAAQRGVEEATRDVEEAENDVLRAVNRVIIAEAAVVTAKQHQRIETQLLLGDEEAVNRALLERLAINQRLLGVDPAAQIQNLTDQLLPLIPLLFATSPSLPFISGGDRPNRAFAEQIAEALLNNPNALRDLFRQMGVSGFAEGGLITKPVMSMMGEGSRPEMVLPLTKPDRVWQLLSSTLPRFPGAMAAARTAVGPAPVSPRLTAPTSSASRRVERRDDGPMTFGQAQQIIRLLEEGDRMNLTVEAPITVSSSVDDPDALARKITQRVERSVIDRLRR